MKYSKSHTPFPFYATEIIKPVVNLRISVNHDKVERLSAMEWGNSYKGDCFSIIESLFIKTM